MSVKVDLRGLRKFESTVKKLSSPGSGSPLRRAMIQWGAIYRSEMQERFVRNSSGGGDWPPHAASTRKRRGPQALILRDTGVLLMAFNPRFQGNPGALQKDIPFGVRVGFGGNKKHPKAKIPVAQLAQWHQIGAGALPIRTLVVNPSKKTIIKMAKVAQRALSEAAREASRG